MQNESRGTIQETISANMDSLTPQLRIAAGFVAENPNEVASRSLRYVAGITNLSPPTFSRLARALGFATYEDLREACRNQLQQQRLIFAEKAATLQEGEEAEPGKGTFIVRHGSAVIGNINTLLNSIDPQQIEHVSALLEKANRVLLIGNMSSRPFVDYMGYMASMAFENWQVLDQGSSSPAIMQASIRPHDVVLVICKAPYAKRSIEIARHAREVGATVIGITDSTFSPLSVASNISLIVTTESPQFFSSHVATLVLIEAIIGMTVAKSGKGARARIAAIESASHDMGEYWSID